MTCWSYLPTDILHIVFEYLDGEHATLDSAEHFSFPKQSSSFPTRDISQCQLTCKSWAGLAQNFLYKNVKLYYSNKLADTFIHTLKNYKLGSLVETIIIVFIRRCFREPILHLIPQIGYWCPNLKGLYTNLDFIVLYWEHIQIERSRGFFSKLQAVTSPKGLKNHEVIQKYHEAVYSLRKSLRALTIYHEKSAPIKNLEDFTNLHALYFKLDKFNDVYTLDQQIKRCSSSVKLIDIQYNGSADHLIHITETRSSIHICRQVKQLLATQILFDNRLFGYLMKAFPVIKKLELQFKSHTTRPSTLFDKVSNSTALLFLSYLTKMSSASVSYFPVDDIEGLLMNFQDVNGIVRHLKIKYDNNNSYHHDSYYLPSLMISTTDRKIDILVTNRGNKLINLPRIGMIEKSGRKLQSLTLDMGMEYEFMYNQEFGVTYNGTDFYHILLYCPNLKNIHIINNLLPCVGMYLQQKQALSFNTFIFERCFINYGFFSALSFHVTYINTLIIRDTSAIGKFNIFSNNKFIQMALTEFNSIRYFDNSILHRIFLKLEKTREDSVRWFVSKKNKFEPCTEDEFEESLHDQLSMTFDISCVDIRTIEINIIQHNIIFKT